MSHLTAALAYAVSGWPVFPLQPRGKQPLGALAPHGVKDATIDPTQVIAWWTVEPEANIGVATGGGRFVLDLDDADARARLEAAGIVLPTDGPIATTGHGAHIWFAGDAGNRTKVVEKVDVRGEGGYVVAPPSVHPEGGRYAWVNDHTAPLPAPPASLTALLGTGKKSAVPAANGSSWVAELLAGVGEGGRDDACTRLAGYFLGKGLPVEVAEALLQTWADRCTPPFPADQVSKCVASIAGREERAPSTPAPSVASLMDETMKLILNPVRNMRTTGLRALDLLLDGGLEPGTTTLLGGRPGTGKTALMLQMARHSAAAGVGVLFVTLEMGATRLIRRMLSQISLVPFANLKSGDLVEGQRANLAAAGAALAAMPFWIETRVGTVEAIGAVLAEYAPGQIGLVMVDYLQKLRAPDRITDARQHVEHVSLMLTRLAQDRNLPFVVASSLSRPDRANASWRPTMASLRESGQLEHDADNIVLLYREEAPNAPLEVNVGKQRDGSTGRGILYFKGEILTFTDGMN